MIKLKFFSDFCSSEQVMKNYINVYGISNPYNNIEIVTDDSYTHACIINAAMPRLNIKKENVIGFSFEPIAILYPIFIRKNFFEYAKKHIRTYYTGFVTEKIPKDIFSEHYAYQWHKWKSHILENNNNKKHIMSIIVSEKIFLPGHKYRHALLYELLKYDIDLHIWGRGSTMYHDKRVKGPFGENTDPYDDYYFTISVENSQSNYYITEKFVDPLVKACIPIYLGARKIKKIFKSDSYYLLKGKLDEDVRKIVDIYNNFKNYLVKDFTSIQNEIFRGNGFLFKFLESELNN